MLRLFTHHPDLIKTLLHITDRVSPVKDFEAKHARASAASGVESARASTRVSVSLWCTPTYTLQRCCWHSERRAQRGRRCCHVSAVITLGIDTSAASAVETLAGFLQPPGKVVRQREGWADWLQPARVSSSDAHQGRRCRAPRPRRSNLDRETHENGLTLNKTASEGAEQAEQTDLGLDVSGIFQINWIGWWVGASFACTVTFRTVQKYERGDGKYQSCVPHGLGRAAPGGPKVLLRFARPFHA